MISLLEFLVLYCIDTQGFSRHAFSFWHFMGFFIGNMMPDIFQIISEYLVKSSLAQCSTSNEKKQTPHI